FKTNYTVKHQKNLPPLYPNGWIPAIESSDVNNSRIVNVQLCGEELIVFRGREGEVHVLDAYCPHLGAKLSSGGHVMKLCNEVCVRCPFHGWVFRANDGLCVQVPYTQTQSAPKGVRIKTYSNVEMHGFIYVWFHADGLEATWRIPKINEINSKWFDFVLSQFIHCFKHYKDIPENGADVYHFLQLHPWSTLMGSNLDTINNNPFLSTILKHNFESSWTACDSPENHKSLMYLKLTSLFLTIPLIKMEMNVEQIGPSVVHLYFKSLMGVEGVLIQNVLPVRPFEQKLIHRLYITPGFLSKLFSKFMLYGESTM
ncbi:Rieske domain-containing protein-like protein, partial [Leptotrombidium deliense]